MEEGLVKVNTANDMLVNITLEVYQQHWAFHRESHGTPMFIGFPRLFGFTGPGEFAME